MRAARNHGFSIVESLVALAMVAVVSAALLPAVALAGRLQRESAVETEAVTIASATLERVKAQMPGVAATGGSLEARAAGWYALVNREGAEAGAEDSAYECRWHVSRLAVPATVVVLSVRVIPLAADLPPVTIATAVRDE